jgi:hypothetical protein
VHYFRKAYKFGIFGEKVAIDGVMNANGESDRYIDDIGIAARGVMRDRWITIFCNRCDLAIEKTKLRYANCRRRRPGKVMRVTRRQE